MTKQEWLQQTQRQCERTHGISISIRNTADIVDTAIQMLAQGIKKDGRFTLPGLGTFTVRRRAARTGRNPQTGAEIKIKASRTVGFKPSPSFKKTL